MDIVAIGRLAVEVGKSLIPPDGGDEKIKQWRRVVAILIGVNLMVSVVHIAWACGWLSYFGLMGFAQAGELEKKIEKANEQRVAIERKLDAVQKYTIQTALKDALRIRCISILQNNQISLDSANRDIDTLQDVYYGLTGRMYAEPDCAVVLIAKGSNGTHREN